MGRCLETKPKNLKSYVWGLILPFISWDFCFSTVGCSAKKIKNRELGQKKLIWIASMFTCLALKDFLEFLLCLKSDFVQDSLNSANFSSLALL